MAAGGRTGITAITTGLLFLASLFVAPLVGAIPTFATAPALIIVGALMLSTIGTIDWDDPLVALPAFLTLVTIPLTYSIATGLSFGIISFAVLRLFSGRARKEDWLLIQPRRPVPLPARFAVVAMQPATIADHGSTRPARSAPVSRSETMIECFYP